MFFGCVSCASQNLEPLHVCDAQPSEGAVLSSRVSWAKEASHLAVLRLRLRAPVVAEEACADDLRQDDRSERDSAACKSARNWIRRCLRQWLGFPFWVFKVLHRVEGVAYLKALPS